MKPPSLEEIRKAIEDARCMIDSIGHYKMEFDKDGYTIRLSRRLRCRVTYHPDTKEIVLILPNDIQCRLDEKHEMALLKMYAADTDHAAEQLEYTKDRLQRAEKSLAQSWYAQSCMDTELALENARLSRAVWELQNQIQEMEMRHHAMGAEAHRIIIDDQERLKRARDARKKSEEEKKSAEERHQETAKKLQETKEEMKQTKRRNSRLAAEANNIKAKYKYKTPIAGKRGGKHKKRIAPAITTYEVADQTHCHMCSTKMGPVTERRRRILETIQNGTYSVIEYDVTRRWCRGCKKLIYTPIPDALPKQRFGNRMIAMISFLKMIGVSFRKIQMIWGGPR